MAEVLGTRGGAASRRLPLPLTETLRLRLERLTVVFLRRRCPVRWHPYGGTATDGRTIFIDQFGVLPPPESGLDIGPAHYWAMLRASVAHECWHVLWTDFAAQRAWLATQAQPRLAQHILNILEDARIEFWGVNHFPGLLEAILLSNRTAWETRPVPADAGAAALWGLVCLAVVGRLPKGETRLDIVDWLETWRLELARARRARRTADLLELAGALVTSYCARWPVPTTRPPEWADGEDAPTPDEAAAGADGDLPADFPGLLSCGSGEAAADVAPPESNPVALDAGVVAAAEEVATGDSTGSAGSSSAAPWRSLSDLVEAAETEWAAAEAEDAAAAAPAAPAPPVATEPVPSPRNLHRGVVVEHLVPPVHAGHEDVLRTTLAHTQATRRRLYHRLAALLYPAPTDPVRRRPRGRLAASDLWRVPAYADARVFYRPGAPAPTRNVAIGLLVDMSGSMAVAQRIEAVRQATVAVTETLLRLGVPVAVTGYTERSMAGQIAVAHYDLLRWGEGLEALARLATIEALSDNRDGLSIAVFGREVLQQPASHKLLIVLSDGQPAASGYYGRAAVEDTQWQIQQLRRRGLGVVGLFFGDCTDWEAARQIYGRDVALVSRVAMVPEVLALLVRRLVAAVS